MTIVAKAETRNSQWANDRTSFGRKMLAKMGWKGDGCGLGKEQQGSSVHLRAVRRVESLGIGAENDAFGDKGWHETNAGFHGVLASLKREYGKSSSSSSSRVGDDGGDREEEEGRKKEGRKRGKREEDGATIKKKKRGRDDGGNDDDGGGGGVRLPQNKVQAGHARKMREAKDIRSKSAEDMAAIFGVRADQYKQQYTSVVVDEDGRRGAGDANSSSSDATDERGGKSRKEKKQKKEKKEKKKTGESKVTVEDVACSETDGKSNETGRGKDEKKKKKKKKKRRRSSEVEAEGDSSDDRKRRKEDKSRK